MTDRTTHLQVFLRGCGWSDATRSVLAADASSRSYDRLFDMATNRCAVLMNAPPGTGSDIAPFVQVTGILRAFGLSAPEIYHCDAANGFLLIEDLGDDLFARVCERDPAIESLLYQTAIDVLVDLHRHPSPTDIPPYDLATYLREAKLVTEWYLPAATGAPVSSTVSAEFGDLITRACKLIPHQDTVLVQRDYHAENLLWLPDRSGVKQVGLLDYQDALSGHPAYDLVSLLEDARRDTSKDLQIKMIHRYCISAGINHTEFQHSYNILGAQRNLKIIGIFARLYLRDNKAGYLDLIPRVWAHLMRDLTHPTLADLQLWVQKNLPEPSADILSRIKDSAHGS